MKSKNKTSILSKCIVKGPQDPRPAFAVASVAAFVFRVIANVLSASSRFSRWCAPLELWNQRSKHRTLNVEGLQDPGLASANEVCLYGM